MTPPAETTTPPGTVAAILEQIIHSAHPRLDKPSIAHHHRMTLVDLDAILHRHGYPDKNVMRRHRDELLARHRGAHDAVQVPEQPETATTAPAAWSDPEHDVQADIAQAVGDGPAMGLTDEPEPAGVEPTAAAGDDAPAGDPGARDLLELPVNTLHNDPENPREGLRDIEDLADSIREVGLLQPIVARSDGQRLIVVAGHRRLAAVKLLRWTHVDVIVRPGMRPDHVLAAMFIENTQRSDLDPIEEARALNKIRLQHDLSEPALANKVGRSLAFVNGRLLLLQLPIEQQEAVRARELGVTAATHKARHDAGRTRPGAIGRPSPAHLSATHALATRAANRCKSHGHSRGKGTGVGGVACGVCWEAVIRSDERQHIQNHSERTGTCGICGQSMPSSIDDAGDDQ